MIVILEHMKKVLSFLLCLMLFTGIANLYATPALAASSVTPSVEIGEDFFVALDNSGVAWTWGMSSTAVTTETTPTAVNGAATLKFSKISAGTDHVLALTADGKVYTWGSNTYGQLGCDPDTTASSSTPIVVAGALDGKQAVAVAASNCASFALLADGSLYSWGDNQNGLLGLAETSVLEQALSPQQVDSLKGVFIIDIFASDTNVAAIAADGSVYLWGKNNYLQTGAEQASPVCTPVHPTVSSDFFALSVVFGTDHTSFLCKDGTVKNIGRNSNRQFGNSATSNSTMNAIGIEIESNYTDFASDINVSAIAAGNLHMIGLTDAGDVYAWGNLNYAQLGSTASNGTYNQPTAVTYFDEITVVAIDSRGLISAAIDESGFVYLWGEPYYTPVQVTTADGGNFCLGTSPDDIVQNAYVTATAVVPAPTYTITIPAELGADDLMQTSAIDNKSIPFTVSASNVDNLFGEQKIIVSVGTESGSFVLTNESQSHQLKYNVYNKQTDGSALQNGAQFAEFTEDSASVINGRIEIDQSQIVYTDEYSGTIIFEIALVPVEEEEGQ